MHRSMSGVVSWAAALRIAWHGRRALHHARERERLSGEAQGHCLKGWTGGGGEVKRMRETGWVENDAPDQRLSEPVRGEYY